MSTDDWAVVGRVRRAHGIRGELLVEPFTDAPDAIFVSGRRVFAGTPDGGPAARTGRMANAPDELVIREVRPFKGGVLLTFDEVPDRTEAERWNDRTLLLPLSELDPPEKGEIFLHELPGMRVVLEDGASLGTILRFYELPQGVVLDVALDGLVDGLVDGAAPRREVLVPFVDDVVLGIDEGARVITVRLPDGLLE